MALAACGGDVNKTEQRTDTWPTIERSLATAVDRGKLEASLPGYRFVTTDNVDEPDLVIADVSRVEPDEVADAYPDIPLLGFTNHKDTAGLRAAHTAGFDQVVAKSALVERTEELVGGLLASVE